MKVGADNKKKTIFALLFFAVAIFLVIRSLVAGPETSTAPRTVGDAGPAAPAQTRRSALSGERRYVSIALAPTLDPRLRLDLLKGSEGVRYEGTGRNIFREHLEDIPQQVQGGLKKGDQKPEWRPPAPTSPPPINLKFYGWANQPGEPKAIFLTQGDDVFLAHEGDIIAHRYKIVKIGVNSVEIEDVLSNNRQSIALTQG
jgi:hypothetical protein